MGDGLDGLLPEWAFYELWLALAAGGLSTVAIERCVVPRPPLRRAAASWALHVGVWVVAYILAVAALGRPWFAALVVAALFFVLVQVNNAKFRSLREPFLFQDYDYFTDALRHPRLYIPFLGWGRFVFAALAVGLAVAAGLWLEGAPPARWRWSRHLGAIAVALVVGVALLWSGARGARAATFRPRDDLQALGFVGSLWRYAWAARRPTPRHMPFVQLVPAAGLRVPPATAAPVTLPHLVAIQSESFFDPRGLVPGVPRDVLAAFDGLQAEAALAGALTVPAWGANTIRTEFAFLTGIDETELGVARFNAFRAVAAGWRPASLASWLKGLGYRTVCIHPYPASFYQRRQVYPNLGFDAFLDIQAFAGAAHAGPFTADAAVADQVVAVLARAPAPTFVMAITMENHGPLHLEAVSAAEHAAAYDVPPPLACRDLTAYLRHLRHADAMAARLRAALSGGPRPASLCWYGDHVPILPQVYQTYGPPAGTVPYACWNSWESGAGRHTPLRANDLAAHWLRAAGLAAVRV